MSSGRRSLPIRWRLGLISAALTFFILLVFAVAVGELTTSRIRSDFNGQLATAADDLQSRLNVFQNPNTGKILTDPNLQEYGANEHAAIRVLRGDGIILAQTKKPRAPNFGVPPGESFFQADGYSVAQRTVLLQGVAGPITLQYGRRISDVDATAARVQTFLIVGVLGGSLLALVAGLWLARRAMRPIEDLTSAAREIGRTRDTSRRIPQPRADDEIAELASTLDEMLQALEASRQASEAMLTRQRQFVADASHELRTPLTSVLANLELLADVLDGERGEAARSALRSSQRMRRLVADLLLLARADARREVVHAPTDLAAVLIEAAAELEPVAGEHHLTIDAPRGAWVEGARDDLHRLALNLMENAVRHTPPGTTIRAAVARADADIVLTVADDGPGIPPDMRERVFERFVRAKGDSGRSFGLGLAIVRAVAETHGGTVTIEDAAPGARFVVRLPRIRAPFEPPVEPASRATESGHPLTASDPT